MTRAANGVPVQRIGYAGPDAGCGYPLAGTYSVNGVSDGGRYVVIGHASTEAARVVSGFLLLDAVPHRRGDQAAVHFSP